MPLRRSLLGFVAGAALAGPSGAALAQSQTTAPLPGVRAPATAQPPAQAAVLPPPDRRLNPTGRQLEIFVPLIAGERRLGEVLTRITIDDQVSVLLAPLVEILGPALSAETKAALEAGRTPDGFLTREAAAAAGLLLTFDPRRMEVQAVVAASDQSVRRIAIADLDRTIQGRFLDPEPVSAFLNVRGSADYQHRGGETGLRKPYFDLEFASRLGPVVLEAYGGLDLEDGDGLTRRSTTLVYDMPQRRIRSRLGDVQTPAMSFQDAPSLLGVSFERLYRAFEPQRNIRPRSFDAFQLDSQSEVDILVNGRVVRRAVLAPGRYQLDDFPFVGGSNDVQIIATDRTGRQEIARFSRFFDPMLLAPGLDEFGFAAGVRSTPGLGESTYDRDDWFASGFYRRGISNNLTAGANLQGDADLAVVGGEIIWSTPMGVVGADLAISEADAGSGGAARINYQFLNNGGGAFQGFSAMAETRSPHFGRGLPTDADPTQSGVAWTSAVAANFIVAEDNIASVNASFSKGRGLTPDVYDVNGSYGFRWGGLPQFSVSAGYRHSERREERGFSLLFGFTTRFGTRSFASAEYDTRENRGVVTFNQASLRESNSYNLNARLDMTAEAVGGSGAVNLIGNRGEAGLSHTTVLNDSGEVTASRTALRGAFSVATTGGKAALGRPVYDSFAIVSGHPTLDGADVWVDRVGERYAVRSGPLGPALVNDITSYNPRTIRADAPAAPPGYDFGSGSFRVMAPYRAGYDVTVGSEYTVTVMGVLTEGGQPLVLATGTARSLDDPQAPQAAVFTNRNGRFSASGLKPGRWRLTMNGVIPLEFDVTVPPGAVGLHQVGVLETNP